MVEILETESNGSLLPHIFFLFLVSQSYVPHELFTYIYVTWFTLQLYIDFSKCEYIHRLKHQAVKDFLKYFKIFYWHFWSASKWMHPPRRRLETQGRIKRKAGEQTKESKTMAWRPGSNLKEVFVGNKNQQNRTLPTRMAADLSSPFSFFNFPRNPQRAQTRLPGKLWSQNLTTCHPVTYGRPG